MGRIKTFVIICIIVLAAILVIGGTYKDGFKNDTIENLRYLNQYENQDWYRSNPSIWPISQIPQTVENDIIRSM